MIDGCDIVGAGAKKIISSVYISKVNLGFRVAIRHKNLVPISLWLKEWYLREDLTPQHEATCHFIERLLFFLYYYKNSHIV